MSSKYGLICVLRHVRGVEMMKKRITAVLTAAVLCAGLTGCGKNLIPDMTDEQVKAMGEYIAITMMKYDANHRSRLVDLSRLEQKQPSVTPSPEQPEEPSGMGAVDDTPVVDSTVVENPYTMEDVLALPGGVVAVYSGYRLCDVYPDGEEGELISLPAAEGKKLLVLSFLLNNTSDQEQQVDLLSSGAGFRITVNETYTRRALSTTFINDMLNFKGAIPAGSSTEVVILVEVSEETASSLSSVSLNVKNDVKTYTIQIL